jgi:cyclopropane fatty-acyl-phospholipid synthase-like methyltransferase
MFPGFGLLSLPNAYIALQRALGADRLRYICIDELRLEPGDVVLDVGCGPAYYLHKLAPGVRYVGYDTSERYIEYARKRFARDEVDFRCGIFSPEAHGSAPKFTAVMLMGVLHHLSDAECKELLAGIRETLAPSGRVISLDTCFTEGDGAVSRWMAEHDRGEFVRTPEGFTSLAGEFFADVEGKSLDGITRVPSSFWVMQMRP